MKEHFEYVAYCLHLQLGHNEHMNKDGIFQDGIENCDEEICRKSADLLNNL